MRSPPSRTRRARIRPLAVALALSACGPATLGWGFTLAFVGAPAAAYAQRSISTQKLIDQARERFEEQQYDESIQKLSAALLRPDITPAQKIDVYRWLAYNYIVL